MRARTRLTNLPLGAAPVVLTLVSSSLILLAAGANPFEAFANIIGGAFESWRKFADVLVALVPLMLCAAGMLITFAAALWNIGIEGQIIMGALFTTAAVRWFPLPSALILPITILAGMLGGALWGLLVGLMRTHGHVNEIFGGLGLNYIAIALTNYFIFGPWKSVDGATMSGTDPFPAAATMPLIAGTRASWPPLIIALLAIAGVYLVLNYTRWGLHLKAIGLNAQAAGRMGIRTTANILLAFAACGALAGLAGSFQTTAVYYRLIPSISSGYGYLSQLVVLLSLLRAEWVPLIVLFFSIISVGSPRLELRMQLDSSLGGILQGSIVLFFLLTRGLQQRLSQRRERKHG
ncbi:MAG: ABC transporter permease [Chloroflexi bacterium]|nr:ABC transporter permease [Chloroflexota bacterium]